ncbi:pyridoxamine 5'-phosphate oxidase family protein [Microlunatus soli]|uniref:General stress protein 26 n=1 Tax=Microlunatus soli TaxID=630515 RepID=A0A1H1NE43_9ACTN|nr:pyridoxamine 5'-phosphate oxidase family protein [Microlunatus soli]SDR97212.1 General stress protein 26 [Microlunatus soli]
MTGPESELTAEERATADRQAVADVVEKARIAVLTTIASDGSLVSRPMALQQRRFDDDLYFFTPDPSDKTDQVRSHPAVNVAIHSAGSYLSLSGSASISKDPTVIDELWDAGAAAWFDAGRNDPAVALLVVSTDSAELQSIDGPRILTLAKYAKAVVTKDHPDVGDSTRLDL